MTTFQNGPAAGQRLMLHRAPIFLRVVEAAGKWDALDQLNDNPSVHEKLHAYVLAAKPGMCHIRASKGGGFYPIAEYRLVEPQPPESEMRYGKIWCDWCYSQPRPTLA